MSPFLARLAKRKAEATCFNSKENTTGVCVLSPSSTSHDRITVYQLGSVGDRDNDAGNLLV